VDDVALERSRKTEHRCVRRAARSLETAASDRSRAIERRRIRPCTSATDGAVQHRSSAPCLWILFTTSVRLDDESLALTAVHLWCTVVSLTSMNGVISSTHLPLNSSLTSSTKIPPVHSTILTPRPLLRVPAVPTRTMTRARLAVVQRKRTNCCTQVGRPLNIVISPSRR